LASQGRDAARDPTDLNGLIDAVQLGCDARLAEDAVEGTSSESFEAVALNADVVGYSRLLADDPDATIARLADIRHQVESQITAGSGTLINFVGDNFMAIFDEAKAAVATAIAITTEIETQNRDVPQIRWMRFRMGLDGGSLTMSQGSYASDALNIAARIQSIAPPGGISISGRVYRALDEPALRFRPLGQQRLKNIPEEVEVYEFADLPSAGTDSPRLRSVLLEAPTVAVLPIHTEEVAEQVRSVGNLIRLDLIFRLSQVPELHVVDSGVEPGRLAGRPTARYMLETGVHEIGGSVRVYATLFDVTTMNVVNSYKWTARVDELPALSEQIANEVAQGIEIELIVGEPAGLYADLEDPEAIEKVYLGWYHLRTGTPEGWARAVELFDDVAGAQPDQPYGHVLGAFALWAGASNEWARDTHTTLMAANKKARTAIELGDPTGMAQAVQAAIYMSEGRLGEALETVSQLEIRRPTCDVTYGLEGSIRRYLGQWEKAVDLLDVAMRLTGIVKPWYPTVQACSLYIGGRVEQAASLAETVVEYQPHNLEALLVLAAAQVELGLERRARATAETIRQRFPSADIEAWLDRTPFQSREIVERWKHALEGAEAIRPG
jgi:adenylate cyclase